MWISSSNGEVDLLSMTVYNDMAMFTSNTLL